MDVQYGIVYALGMSFSGVVLIGYIKQFRCFICLSLILKYNLFNVVFFIYCILLY